MALREPTTAHLDAPPRVQSARPSRDGRTAARIERRQPLRGADRKGMARLMELAAPRFGTAWRSSRWRWAAGEVQMVQVVHVQVHVQVHVHVQVQGQVQGASGSTSISQKVDVSRDEARNPLIFSESSPPRGWRRIVTAGGRGADLPPRAPKRAALRHVFGGGFGSRLQLKQISAAGFVYRQRGSRFAPRFSCAASTETDFAAGKRVRRRKEDESGR